MAASTSCCVTRGNSWCVPPVVAAGFVTLSAIGSSPAGTTTIVLASTLPSSPALTAVTLTLILPGKRLRPTMSAFGHGHLAVGPEADPGVGADDAPRGHRVGVEEVEVLEPDDTGRLRLLDAHAGRRERTRWRRRPSRPMWPARPVRPGPPRSRSGRRRRSVRAARWPPAGADADRGRRQQEIGPDASDEAGEGEDADADDERRPRSSPPDPRAAVRDLPCEPTGTPAWVAPAAAAPGMTGIGGMSDRMVSPGTGASAGAGAARSPARRSGPGPPERSTSTRRRGLGPSRQPSLAAADASGSNARRDACGRGTPGVLGPDRGLVLRHRAEDGQSGRCRECPSRRVAGHDRESLLVGQRVARQAAGS